MAERDLRAKLKARVESYGGSVRAVQWLQRRGAPDVLCLFPGDSYYCTMFRPRLHHLGHSAWVETKDDVGAEAHQLREHDRMRDCNCDVRLIRNENELDAWLPKRV